MHIGSTHLSNVGKERSQPSTNEPVRAERGSRLHAESIRPRFYNLTTTSQERRPCRGFTTSSRLEEHCFGVDGLDYSTRSTQKPFNFQKTTQSNWRAVFMSLFWRWPFIILWHYCVREQTDVQIGCAANLYKKVKKKKSCPMWGRESCIKLDP